MFDSVDTVDDTVGEVMTEFIKNRGDKGFGAEETNAVREYVNNSVVNLAMLGLLEEGHVKIDVLDGKVVFVVKQEGMKGLQEFLNVSSQELGAAAMTKVYEKILVS